MGYVFSIKHSAFRLRKVDT